MDSNDLMRLLIEHTDAWNSHDIGRLMVLFADDCVFAASGGPEFNGRMFEGRAQVRAAFLEVVNDALGSAAVLVAAVSIAWFGWLRADAVASLLIGVLILPRTWRLPSPHTPDLRDAN